MEKIVFEYYVLKNWWDETIGTFSTVEKAVEFAHNEKLNLDALNIVHCIVTENSYGRLETTTKRINKNGK